MIPTLPVVVTVTVAVPVWEMKTPPVPEVALIVEPAVSSGKVEVPIPAAEVRPEMVIVVPVRVPGVPALPSVMFA